MKTLKLLTIILALSISSAFASDIQQMQSTLYPYKSVIEFQDDFITGINSTGNAGYGWGVNGGSATWANSEANRYGILRRSTGAAAGTVARTDLGTVNSNMYDPGAPSTQTFVIRMVDTDADTQLRAGGMNASFSPTPLNGIYFETLYADTNWFCVARSAGVQTRVDSGVARSGNWIDLKIISNSSGLQWHINGTPVCGVITTNIPVVFLEPATQLTNQVAVSKSHDFDYYQVMFAVSR